jgi:hypothetical protein
MLRAIPEFDFEKYKGIEDTPEGKAMFSAISPRLKEMVTERRQARINDGTYRSLRVPEIWTRDNQGRYTQACGSPLGSQRVFFHTTPHEPGDASSSAGAGPSGGKLKYLSPGSTISHRVSMPQRRLLILLWKASHPKTRTPRTTIPLSFAFQSIPSTSTKNLCEIIQVEMACHAITTLHCSSISTPHSRSPTQYKTFTII